jgi:hypothetical protein
MINSVLDSARIAGVFATMLVLVACFGLGLQYWLLIRSAAEPIRVTVNFFSYFTILTNLLAAIVLVVWLRSTRGTRLVELRSATAVYIAIVGIVYTLVLRELWNPTGLQAVADLLLHDVVPVAYVLYWFGFVEKGSLSFPVIARWLAYPLLFFAYSLGRGAATGWYPYPFIDALRLGYGRVLLNAGSLVVGFVMLAAVFVAVDNALGGTLRRRPRMSPLP